MDAAAALKAWPGARIAVLSPTPTHPQDFGNRKRIYRICRRYADEGARITYIHYPSEFEWRKQIPYRGQHAMSAAWERFYTIAPTREPHEDPAGTYHSIDEWWDNAIGDFLTWLFASESFDIFIVNYSWLSKALEYAPPSTFRILDTHDKFSGRKEMLESLGLNPEFFYTTEAQERIALGRADLVWAIKPEEAEELQRLTDKPVLALQHLDPFEPLAPAAADPQGYFRVGVIGARNNVNRMNIGEFLREAEPIFRNAFAPVKIVIAGSVCDILEDAAGPFVELVGRVDDVEEFYRSVDCVAVPMRRSTGLKIKTGEALSYGLPVLSLAHAFEGYEPAHKYHAFADFQEMAQAIVGLSFAPRAQLETLATASAQAHKKTASLIARSFRRSDAMAREKRGLVVVAVDSRSFTDGNIFELVLQSLLGTMRGTASVAALVVRGNARDVADAPGAVDRLRRVIVASDLPGAAELSGELAALGVEVFDVAQYLDHAQPTVVIADALHPGLTANELPRATVVLRPDMVRLSDPGAPLKLALGQYGKAVVSGSALSKDVAGLCAECGATFVPAPMLWSRGPLRIRRAPVNFGRKTIALLGRANGQAMAMAIAMARAWDLKPYIVALAPPAAAPEGVPFVPPPAFFASIVEGRRTPPDFAVELDADESGIAFCREMLDRLRVPTITTSPVGVHPAYAVGDRPLYADSEHSLWRAMRTLALSAPEEIAAVMHPEWGDQQREHSWQALWRICAGPPEPEDMEFA